MAGAAGVNPGNLPAQPSCPNPVVARLAGTAGVTLGELPADFLTNAAHLSVPARVMVEQPEQRRLMMILAAHLRHHLPEKQAEQHRLAMIPDSCQGHHQSLLTLAYPASLGHHLAVKQSEH